MIHKHFDQAINKYESAIELKPDYADSYKNRGNAYEVMGEPDLAIADLKKAIELTSNPFKPSP